MATFINGTQQLSGEVGFARGALADLEARLTDLIPGYGGVRDIGVGTLAQRPAPGTPNKFFWTTDERQLYRDTGTEWEALQAQT